ncbi:hypothetical protein ABL78_0542 [Leptomonas seymouri]|uniref:Uncharacterized protein n=1 Tax=Leptomonas seymouri TaxID=5684 RepID=A0A0N1IA33_LEPSE|nr:hypothetical protein ABL78_0542 [Leptomonas seymouri]|eukprot:KPI90315.1 hypothetical protein ABL78_0542 [Leptomonas seymouri]
MPSAAAAKSGGAVQLTSPKKDPTHRPSPTKPTLTSLATDNNRLPSATAKGSRRAQGWHSAVGGGQTAGIGSTTGSNAAIGDRQSDSDNKGLMHNRASSGIPRRLSVQFNEEVLGNEPTVPALPKLRMVTSNKDDTAFRQNMSDFLSVMYGDRTGNSGTGTASAGMPTTANGGSAGASHNVAQKSVTSPSHRRGSSHLSPSEVKGPLVKGLTANGSRYGTEDHIDTLVNTLVRAYSRQTISSRSDFHGSSGGPDDDNANMYNRSRQQNYRRAVASSRLGQGSGYGGIETKEVSVFVSQAMDSFIGPGGLLQQGLPSTRSVLSSLGVDKNIFRLMSFKTNSNMQDVDTVEDSLGTKLEPMYVGEQAMFKSVGTRPQMNDISVSKSMRGVIPSSYALEEGINGGGGIGAGTAQREVNSGAEPHRRSNGPLKNRLEGINLSLDGEANVGKRDGNGGQKDGFASKRAVVNSLGGKGNTNMNMTRCMSLDSKALGMGVGNGNGGDADDSWEDDAPIPPTTSTQVLVSSTRSLLNYSKACNNVAVERALKELFEEEQLKRDVVMAVERQLQGYIFSLEKEEREKKKRKK